MHQLFSGIYPDVPPFGVFFTQGNEKLRPATLLFYTPRGEKDKERIIQEGERLLVRASFIISNFANSIIWKRFITSLDYPKEIGFKNCVLPVAEMRL